MAGTSMIQQRYSLGSSADGSGQFVDPRVKSWDGIANQRQRGFQCEVERHRMLTANAAARVEGFSFWSSWGS